MNYDSICVCGHPWSAHVPLPGHPDGAQDCWGSEECDCGQYRDANQHRDELDLDDDDDLLDLPWS